MGNNEKSRPAAGNSDPAGRNEAEQLTVDYPQYSTPNARRQQLLTYDAAMAAADAAGDIDGYVDAFFGFLDTVCGGAK